MSDEEKAEEEKEKEKAAYGLAILEQQKSRAALVLAHKRISWSLG